MKRYHYVSYSKKNGNKLGDGCIYSTRVRPAKHPYTGEPYRFDIRLFYSRLDSGWTDKVSGKCAARLMDDGNGITLTLGGQKIRLGYDEFEKLELLLREHHFVDDNVTHIRSGNRE